MSMDLRAHSPPDCEALQLSPCRFSIASRYPGVSADQQAAEEAMTTAEAVRTAMRVKLGLL
jgi:hypothetical protein